MDIYVGNWLTRCRVYIWHENRLLPADMKDQGNWLTRCKVGVYSVMNSSSTSGHGIRG